MKRGRWNIEMKILKQSNGNRGTIYILSEEVRFEVLER